jgi:NADH-quinone oxidoreductase subunit L
MVTAGVYMVVRCNAIYQNAPTAMFIVAMIGCATAIFAATIGLAQNDIKKVLAYSTVSQLGYMFLACGAGAFIAAIFHVMTHAFFKALLFLGSGSVIHGMHHEQDMRRMGNLRKYMPVTFVTMMTGWLAISGIPIFAGFFSKDEILYKTFASPNLPQPYNYILWGVGLLTAVLTAVYMTRMMWMTFFGTERFHEALPDMADAHDPAHAEENAFASGDAADDETHHGAAHATGEDDDHDDEHHALPHDFKPHESPWVMTVPLIILAVLSTVGGLVGVPYALSGGAIPNVFEETLEPVIAHIGPKAHGIQTASEPGVSDVGHAAPAAEHRGAPINEHAETAGAPAAHAEHSAEELRSERLLAGLSVVLALVGIGIGFALFSKTPLRRMPKILAEKWRVDELYNGYVVDPLTNLSRNGLWKGIDVGFIDGIVNGIGHFVAEAGNLARQMQVGFVRSYAAFILLGALVVLGYFIYFGLKLVG